MKRLNTRSANSLSDQKVVYCTKLIMVKNIFPHITELCEKVEYNDCQQFSNYTVFPNLLGGFNHSVAVQAMTSLQGIIATGCSSHALHFFCSAAFLQCDQGVPKYPCKSLCEGR